MAFASNGDLFVAPRNTYLLRITPAGDVTVFDRFGWNEIATTLAFDDAGNLFAGIVAGTDKIYRYDAGKAENRRLLADDLFAWSGFMALTVTPDQRSLYLVDYSPLRPLTSTTARNACCTSSRASRWLSAAMASRSTSRPGAAT